MTAAPSTSESTQAVNAAVIAGAAAGSAFCPATMCPLFARAGSPWTGDKNSNCEREKCGWWHNGKCVATEWALEHVAEEKPGKTLSKVPHCPRAQECQWQRQSEWLCPPRFAAVNGIDPRVCNY